METRWTSAGSFSSSLLLLPPPRRAKEERQQQQQRRRRQRFAAAAAAPAAAAARAAAAAAKPSREPLSLPPFLPPLFESGLNFCLSPPSVPSFPLPSHSLRYKAALLLLLFFATHARMGGREGGFAKATTYYALPPPRFLSFFPSPPRNTAARSTLRTSGFEMLRCLCSSKKGGRSQANWRRRQSLADQNFGSMSIFSHLYQAVLLLSQHHISNPEIHPVRGTVPAPTAIASCPGIPFPANPPLILFMQVSARVLQLRKKKKPARGKSLTYGLLASSVEFSYKPPLQN